jgi:hypothetical protein
MLAPSRAVGGTAVRVARANDIAGVIFVRV